MARTRATSMEALEKKIEAGQQKVLRTKAAYDEAVEELQKLLDKRTDIQTWRDKRNDVIHDLAKTNIDYSSLKTTCEDGRELFGNYTAIIMKIKKNIDETGGGN